MARSFLFLTGHDYRSSRRSKTHFVIDELAKLGRVRVFSSGTSAMMRLKPSADRWDGSLVFNRVEQVGEVDTYAWRPLAHPFNPRRQILQNASKIAFQVYRNAAPSLLFEWAEQADTILVESGISVLFISKIRARNPSATIIYVASDDLATIGCDPYLETCLEAASKDVSWATIPSPLMAPMLPSAMKCFFVPQGIDKSILEDAQPDPFAGGINAVSIGSMLFDPTFFDAAVKARPDINFHVIGGGPETTKLPAEVSLYPVLPFSELPKFMRHADFGIAPYRSGPGTRYLADTSLKLIQYGLFGLPAVCPEFASANKPMRFGYKVEDSRSIIDAIRRALNVKNKVSVSAPSWAEVTAQLLSPLQFEEVSDLV